MGGNFNLLSLWTKLMETTLLNQQTGFLNFFKVPYIIYIYLCVFVKSNVQFYIFSISKPKDQMSFKKDKLFLNKAGSKNKPNNSLVI